MTSPDLINAFQCLLFVAQEPLPARRAAEVLDVEIERIAELATQLEERLDGHGLYLMNLAGGYTLATRHDYADYVQELLEPDPQRLSRQALEVLAIVAYKQPITRPQIDLLRGVNSSGVINSLIEKNLLRISGRASVPGRPFLLATTSHFLSAFGLGSLDDLPDVALPLPDENPRTEPLVEGDVQAGDEAGTQDQPTTDDPGRDLPTEEQGVDVAETASDDSGQEPEPCDDTSDTEAPARKDAPSSEPQDHFAV